MRNEKLLKNNIFKIFIFIFLVQTFIYAETKSSLRGIWISDPTNLKWDKVVKDLKKAKINNLFINFASAGVAFYDSKILPYNEPIQPLKKLIKLAHENNISVHAKILTFFMFWAPKFQIDKMVNAHHVLLNTNGKMQIQASTPWLDPAQIENQKRIQAVIKEIIENFDIDGIQLDYIRFYEEKDVPKSIMSIRKSVITNFVKETKLLIAELNNKLRYSACIFYNLERAKNEMAQDWETWIDLNIFNFLVPMNYTLYPKQLMKWIYSQEHIRSGGTTLYSGIGAYLKGMTKELLFEQLDNLNRANIPGFILFSYNSPFVQSIASDLGRKYKD